ncbi:MAG: hypothetical protein ACTSQK_00640 [Candidatus Heimdallarchaeota archaeon]
MARKKKETNKKKEQKEPQKQEKKVKSGRKEKRKAKEKKEPRRKKQKKTKKEKKQEPKKPDKIDLNVYNQLFDEINLFSKEISQLKTKDIKQRLILLDGKIIWLEKQSDIALTSEDGTDEIIKLEMEMLEMDMDLETADEMTLAYEASAEDFSLQAIKDDLNEAQTFGDSFRDILKDFEEDTDPMDDLMSKFLLYDMRGSLERAISEVFRLEGNIKNLMKEGEDKKTIKGLFVDQRKAVSKSLKEILSKLKKEKPEMILTEDQMKEFKNLTHKEIAELKAKEEQDFDQMVAELLEQ